MESLNPVSYTHLSLQRTVERRCFRPVSYTHLDVYKRQDLRTLIEGLGCFPLHYGRYRSQCDYWLNPTTVFEVWLNFNITLVIPIPSSACLLYTSRCV